MLSVPTVGQMLTVIGVALSAVVVLIILLNLVLTRIGAARNPSSVPTVSRIPAQRDGSKSSISTG